MTLSFNAFNLINSSFETLTVIITHKITADQLLSTQDQQRVFQIYKLIFQRLKARTYTKDEKDTINNLGNLYIDQNKMIEVKTMFRRARIGKFNELSTLSPTIVRRFVIFICCLYILFSVAEFFRDDKLFHACIVLFICMLFV